MNRLQQNRHRTLWVVIVNAIVICALTTGQTRANRVGIVVLMIGIVFELGRSAFALVVNVGAFLCVPLAWVWERAHAKDVTGFADGEYGISLVLFVFPSVIVAAVNLYFYLPVLRRKITRHGTR